MNYTSNNPAKVERNLNIASDRLAGATYKQLSEAYELSAGMISYILNDEEIKDVIETGTRQMVARVPLAISRFDAILNDPKHSDHYKSVKDCLATTGILPSHAQSVTINNILAVNTGPNSNQINRIQELLTTRQQLDLPDNDDIIDISTDDIRNSEAED